MANVESVKRVLEKIRPQLQADEGDLEFVSLSDDGKVSLRLKGHCNGCPMSAMTLKMGIERVLREEIPEVTEVVQVA